MTGRCTNREIFSILLSNHVIIAWRCDFPIEKWHFTSQIEFDLSHLTWLNGLNSLYKFMNCPNLTSQHIFLFSSLSIVSFLFVKKNNRIPLYHVFCFLNFQFSGQITTSWRGNYQNYPQKPRPIWMKLYLSNLYTDIKIKDSFYWDWHLDLGIKEETKRPPS